MVAELGVTDNEEKLGYYVSLNISTSSRTKLTGPTHFSPVSLKVSSPLCNSLPFGIGRYYQIDGVGSLSSVSLGFFAFLHSQTRLSRFEDRFIVMGLLGTAISGSLL